MALLGKFKVKTNDTKGPKPPLPGQPPKGAAAAKGAPAGVGTNKKPPNGYKDVALTTKLYH